MKKCDGNGLHPGEVIKYDGQWCPLCALAIALQRKDQKIFILEKCLDGSTVKPSRRIFREPINVS